MQLKTITKWQFTYIFSWTHITQVANFFGYHSELFEVYQSIDFRIISIFQES